MEAEDREYTLGNIAMRYSDTPGSGPHTYVLVHGIGMGRIVYAEVAADLANRGRVLAVDLPGFGDSPEPGSTHTLEETAEFLSVFIRQIVNEPVVLVGHSMGTQIVAEVAVNHPEQITHLVLIAPTVNRYERKASTQALRMVQDLTGEGPKVLLLGMWEYAKTSPKWFINKLSFMLAHKLENICPRILTPTLVLRGETDRVCPRGWVREISDEIPHSVMREIPNRGHEAIIKSPEPVSSLIREFASGVLKTDK